MSHKILFKGVAIHSNEWEEGFYYEHQPPLDCVTMGEKKKPGTFIVKTGFADWNMPRPVDLIPIYPESVGQYINQEDKNKKKIFTGDIVRTMVRDMSTRITVGVVCYKSGMLCLRQADDTYNDFFVHIDLGSPDEYWIEVIGNVFTDPDLLEQESAKIAEPTKTPFTDTEPLF